MLYKAIDHIWFGIWFGFGFIISNNILNFIASMLKGGAAFKGLN
jgi:hypothetical protein